MERRVLSTPMRIHWAGWESTTTQLQQQGWQLSAEQDFMRGSLRIALKHEDMRLYGITYPVDYHYFELRQDTRAIVLSVQWMSSNLTVTMMDNLSTFNPIDAYPQIMDIETKNIEDFGIFAVPLARTEEIIVDPNDVAALLGRIKEIQSPQQSDIRERMRKRDLRGMEAKPQQKFHAQILSFAS